MHTAIKRPDENDIDYRLLDNLGQVIVRVTSSLPNAWFLISTCHTLMASQPDAVPNPPGIPEA